MVALSALTLVMASAGCMIDEGALGRPYKPIDANSNEQPARGEVAPPPDGGSQDSGLDKDTGKNDDDEDDDGDDGDDNNGGDEGGPDGGQVDQQTVADTSSDPSPSGCQHCTGYGTPRALGAIPPVVKELSGLAASRRHPGILYAHNDSGDTARFFALDLTAKLNAEVVLAGATNVDWEDLAVGSCATGSCLYIADSGDNDLVRTEYALYRVAEPDTLPTNGSTITVTHERFPFVYPDGPHNAESLLIDPGSGRIFIVVKVGGVSAPVYEMPQPLDTSRVATLVKVATLGVPASAGLVTAGSFHPCGDRILIRTKSGLFELQRPSGGDLLSIFGATPTAVPVAVEQQGEAVEYAVDGLRYYTSSETDKGITPDLSVVECH
jgi:hypothetical protein